MVDGHEVWRLGRTTDQPALRDDVHERPSCRSDFDELRPVGRLRIACYSVDDVAAEDTHTFASYCALYRPV